MPFGRDARPLLGIDRLQAHQAHQPLHALVIDFVALPAQASCHPGPAEKRRAQVLLIVRRPPGPPTPDIGPYTVRPFGRHEAIELLHQRRSVPSWLDERESLINAGSLAALRVELPTGDWGWLVYQKTVFQLARLVLQTEAGDPHRVGLTLIHALHALHPALDTKSENLPLDSPYWPAMQEIGYVESFRRIEMRLDLA